MSQQRKELRRGKVLIDWSQNDEHKTTVCVYSLRARERPTVSTPLDWEELEDPRALVFEAADVLERVEEHGDLFAPVVELRQELPVAVRIREVVLPTPDPEALAGFHADFPARPGCASSPGPAVCSHFALNVPPDRFEEAVAFARERVELLKDDVPFPHWRARAAYFFDPAGNLVELIARERAPGEELFLELSEVGLPVSRRGRGGRVPRGRARPAPLQRGPRELQRGGRRPRPVHPRARRPPLAVHRPAGPRASDRGDDRGRAATPSCACPGPTTSSG